MVLSSAASQPLTGGYLQTAGVLLFFTKASTEPSQMVSGQIFCIYASTIFFITYKYPDRGCLITHRTFHLWC